MRELGLIRSENACMSNNTSVKITSAENLRCSAIDLFAQMESAPNLKSEKILEMGLFGCLVNAFLSFV